MVLVLLRLCVVKIYLTSLVSISCIFVDIRQLFTVSKILPIIAHKEIASQRRKGESSRKVVLRFRLIFPPAKLRREDFVPSCAYLTVR